MPKDFNKKLEELLKKDSRFVDQEGDLLRSNITDAAYKADKKLIEFLISNKELKDKFFSKVKDVSVFNINDFVLYIQDKNFLADSYTKYRNKIGLNIDGKFLNERKEVALVWPFKDCVLEGGMTKEDEKRKEIFFNEILAQDEIDKLLAPKVLTNWKRYSYKGEEEVKELKRDDNGTIKENLIIKGNNLLALHSLKQQFQNKIKLIYIDPPYNTGNDSFGYNDRFNHSTWLTFMKNRLEIAKELLRDDGSIFIQIDSDERDYIKILLDQIFDKKNYLNNIVVRKKQAAGVGQDAFLLDTVEYILMYAKNKPIFINSSSKQYLEFEFDDKLMDDYSEYVDIKGERKFFKTIKDARGGEVKIYKYVKPIIKRVNHGGKNKEFYINNFNKFFITYGPQSSLMKKVIKNLDNKDFYEIEYIPIRGKNQGKMIKTNFYKKRIVQWLNNIAYIKNNKIIKKQVNEVLWTDLSWDTVGLEGDVMLKSGKKPEQLIERIISMSTKGNDIILDFFNGTGTTCAVAHKMGRQYVGVEQLDYGKNSAEVRLKNVINGDQTGISKTVCWKNGGNFIYCELMEYNEEFVEKIEKAEDTKELLKIWEEIKEKGFLKYNVDIKKFDETIDDFKKLSLEKQKHILFDILNKNQLYVNLSDIEDKDFKISNDDKKMNKEFYAE